MRQGDSLLEEDKIRLIDQNNDQVGIVPPSAAMKMAQDAGLDLVCVAPQGKPPVCRLMNYSKYQYEKKKREREQRKKQHTQKNKEIKFHANIDDHDYHTKVTHIVEFLEKGHKVKVSLYFRGREMRHRDIGMELMERVVEDIGDAGEVENTPRMVGRSIIMLLSPGSSK